MELIKFNAESKSIDLKNVPEIKPKKFSIKGCTLEILMTDIGTQMSFSDENGRYTRNRQVITYTPKVGDGTGNMHPLRFPRKILEEFTTYTFCYKIHHCDKNLVKMSKWTQGDGHVELDVRPGVHALTFTTKGFTENWFLYTNLKGPITESREILKIEILGMVKGSKGIRSSVPSGLCGVGLQGKGLEIATQTQNPILGEYVLQGDIPGYLDKIENKIIKNENTFKINWI